MNDDLRRDIFKKIKASLKGSVPEKKRSEMVNIEPALIRDVDGEVDDAWRKAMLELHPNLARAAEKYMTLFGEVDNG